VYNALNYVTERLIKSGRWKGTHFTQYFTVYNNEITCPEDIETVDKVIMIDQNTPNQACSQGVSIQPMWYQFSENGMGLFPTNYVGDTQAIRLGDGYCTYQDPQTPSTFTVNVEATGETGQIVFKCLDANGNPIYNNGVEGISINLQTQIPYTSGDAITSIYEVVKPQTKGRIFVGLTNPTEQIAVYSQAELCPNYQRYRIVGQFPETRLVYALCKRAFVPLLNDNDEVFPFNLNALRYAVQAYAYDQANDLERSEVYWNQAFKMLNEELADFEGDFTRNQIEVQNRTYTHIMNLI